MEKLLPNNPFEASRVVPVLEKLIQFSLFTFAAFSMFSISVTQIAFALGSLAWLLKIHLTKSWEELRGTWVGLAILCFCLSCVLSIMTSVDPGSSSKLLKKLLQFVIIFWVAHSIKDEKQRDLLIKLIIVAGVVAALNGLIPLLSPDFTSRIKGTLSKQSTFSGVLMLSGLVPLGRFLFHKPKEYWVLGSLGIIGFCLLLSLTRQAWLGFFIGAIFLLFFWNKNCLLFIPLLLAVLLLFTHGRVNYRIHSLINIDDIALQARVSTWKSGWKIFKDHPITGCGFKCVDSIHLQYPDALGHITHYRGMHSNIFQLLVDTGVVGLGTWLSIWVAFYIEIFKRWRTLVIEKSQENALGILMGSSAAVLAFLAGGFFETSIYDSEVTMLLYFIMGLSLAQVKKACPA